MRALVWICWAIATLTSALTTCWAEDSDQTHFYLGLRGQDTSPWTDVHDLFGFSLGANLNRYFGVELSGDRFERFPQIPPYGTIGEYGVFALVPQVRLRYPLLGAKLTPYTVGGIGQPLNSPCHPGAIGSMTRRLWLEGNPSSSRYWGAAAESPHASWISLTQTGSTVSETRVPAHTCWRNSALVTRRPWCSI